MIATEKIGDIILAVCAVAHDGLSRKDAETKAVGQLLSYVVGSDCRIAHNSEGAPFIDGSDLKISISHSRDYACIAVSSSRVIGVDIEQPRDQLRRVADRVMSDEEVAVYGASEALLLRAWTLKEALYKAALTPGLDFRRDINLPLDIDCQVAHVLGCPYNILSVKVYSDYTLTLVAR